jgi:hypothetical protein
MRSFRLLSLQAACLRLLFLAPTATFAAAFTWPEVTSEQRDAQAPLLEEDAPAEILDFTMEVDDSDIPAHSDVHIYHRYKIYAADKADSISRISAIENSSSGGTRQEIKSLKARILYADGRVVEYGDKDIKERVLAGSAVKPSFLSRLLSNEESSRKEQFLALGALEKGCIVDVDVQFQLLNGYVSLRGIPLQNRYFPTRRALFTYKGPDEGCMHMACALNIDNGNAKFTENLKKKLTRIEAGPLYRLEKEPFCPPLLDCGLSALVCVTPKDVKMLTRHESFSSSVDAAKDGPWASIADIFYHRLEDRSAPATRRVKELAANLVAGAKDDYEKLRKIHNHVMALHQEFLRTPREKNMERTTNNFSSSLDDVLDFAKKRDLWDITDDDFLFLAIALYREAGFEVRELLLPDSNRMGFREAIISPLLISNTCAAIRFGNDWVYSRPHDKHPLPVGFLPYNLCGQKGLVVKTGKQEIVEVRGLPPKSSYEQNVGVFTLDAEGTLSGECSRRLSGQVAWEARRKLLGKSADAISAFFQKQLQGDLGAAEITLKEVKGVEDRDKLIVLVYSLNYPGYATRTKDRLILRPSVFRSKVEAPFAASRRRNPVIFPFAWQENDVAQITLPAGFVPDLKGVPATKASNTLVHRYTVGFDLAKSLLQVRRDFGLRVPYVPVSKYSELKSSFDNISSDDSFELVLAQAGSPTSEAAAPAATP